MRQLEEYQSAQGTVDQSLGRAAKKTKKRQEDGDDH